MRVFAIGDLHLSGVNPKPMDKFGPGWENHWEKVSARWRERVGQEDIVIIPGDISWALTFEDALVDLETIAQLPGRKVLIRGNHDYWWASLNKMNSALGSRFLIIQNNSISFENFILCGSRGWMLYADATAQDRKIYDREVIRMNLSLESVKERGDKRLIMAVHYPPFVLNAQGEPQPNPMTDLMEKWKVDTVVYGHVHSGYEKFADRTVNGIDYILTSCDYLNFTPRLVAEF